MKQKTISTLFLICLIIITTGCSEIDDIIKINKPKVTKSEVGLAGFEARAEQKICAQKTCFKAVYAASTSNLLSFVIVGNENIRNYLNQNGIDSNGLVNTMDFLEVVKESDGNIRHLRFLVPTNETQNNQITNVCNNIRVECSVEIIVPSKDSDLNNLIDAGCLFFNTVFLVPDYVDAACIIYALN